MHVEMETIELPESLSWWEPNGQRVYPAFDPDGRPSMTLWSAIVPRDYLDRKEFPRFAFTFRTIQDLQEQVANFLASDDAKKIQ